MRVNKSGFILTAFASLIIVLLSEAQCAQLNDKHIDFNFSDPTWKPGVSEYKDGMNIDFISKFDCVVPDVENKKGYFLSSTNPSDDVFMYITKKYSGFDPNTKYRITFSKVVFATNGFKAIGAGGGGGYGESVRIKAGVSNIEPESLKNDNGYFNMNINKGNNASDGKNAVIISTFSKTSDDKTNRYEIKEVKDEIKHPYIETNNFGDLWVLFATDSALQSSRTAIYFISAHADFYKS